MSTFGEIHQSQRSQKSNVTKFLRAHRVSSELSILTLGLKSRLKSLNLTSSSSSLHIFLHHHSQPYCIALPRLLDLSEGGLSANISLTMADEQPQGKDELNDFGKVLYQFAKFGQNATNNVSQVFSEMTPQQWIRLVVIVGAYMLIRPYVLKHATKKSVERMEKDEKERKEKAAAISPNELRDGKIRPDEEDSDDEGESSTTDWGAKARTRQRTMVRKLMEADEQRRQDEKDDEDIADLLED